MSGRETRKAEIVRECEICDGEVMLVAKAGQTQRRESTPVCSLEICLLPKEDQNGSLECMLVPSQCCIHFLFTVTLGLVTLVRLKTRSKRKAEVRYQAHGMEEFKAGTNLSQSVSGPLTRSRAWRFGESTAELLRGCFSGKSKEGEGTENQGRERTEQEWGLS